MRMLKASLPTCHLGHVPGPNAGRTPVWICEYPYRTMRMDGPNAEDCSDCPIWRAMAAAASDVLPQQPVTQPAAQPAAQPVAV